MNKLIELVKLWFKSIFIRRNCDILVYSTRDDKVHIFRNGKYVVADIDFLIHKSKHKNWHKKSIFFLEFILGEINLILENELKNLK